MASGKDFVLEVIEMYRERPCLWQISNNDYHDKIKRNLALEEIVAIFKTKDPTANKETVQKKINSIRSCFRKELNKVKQSQKSGATANEIHYPKLWYFDHMLFLEDQDTPRKNQSDKSIIDDMPFGLDNEESDLETFEDNSSQIPSPANSSFKRQRSKAEQLLKNISKRIDQTPIKNLPQQPQQLLHHPFGEYVAEKLRNMPPEMVPYCQKLINDAIFNAELGLLNLSSRIETSTKTILYEDE